MATASEVRCRVEEVLTRIESLRQYEAAVRDSLQAVETRLQEFRADAPQDVLGQGADQWSNRSDAEKEELLQRLGSMLEALDAIESRARRPSAVQRRLLLAFAIATPLVLLILIFLPVCMGAFPLHDNGRIVHTAWVFLLILMMGALGGSLRLIGSLVYYLGRRKFYQCWLPYYYLAPLEGALIALIVCMLFFGGMFTPVVVGDAATKAGETNAGNEDGGAAPNPDAPNPDAPADEDAGDRPASDAGERPDSGVDEDPETDSDESKNPAAAPQADSGEEDDSNADSAENADQTVQPQQPPTLQPATDDTDDSTRSAKDAADEDAQNGGDNATVLVYMYAIAGLSGLFAKNVMRKLRDLADTLFGKPSQNDSA